MGKGVNEVKEYISEKSIPDVAGHHPLTTVMEYEAVTQPPPKSSIEHSPSPRRSFFPSDLYPRYKSWSPVVCFLCLLARQATDKLSLTVPFIVAPPGPVKFCADEKLSRWYSPSQPRAVSVKTGKEAAFGKKKKKHNSQLFSWVFNLRENVTISQN